jgi:Dolichyl-phosphate-mannose-protein mannosyltransferase
MTSRLRQIATRPAAGWAIVVLGTLLRLRRFMEDRGLMHDDAQLATNIVSKSLAQLFKPLDIGDQAAPAGFLLLQKCSITLFGQSERAIRLIPFLASIAVLPLYFLTVRKLAGPTIALFAVAWLALAEPLVRYAAEGKQYSTDVLWTTVILALALTADDLIGLTILSIAGSVLLWFSHPLLFILGGVGIALFIQHLHQRKKALFLTDIFMGIAWLASFALNYLLISRYYAANAYLKNYWQQLNAFAPLPTSTRNFLWYPRTFAELFDYPMGLLPSARFRIILAVIVFIAAMVFLRGCVMVARSRPRVFGFIALPILLAVAASGLHKYPFAERLTLFCTPLLVLPLAFALGDEQLSQVFRGILAALLFLFPVYIQTKYLIHPEVRYDAKPAIQYIKSHWQSGDTLYLHWGSNVIGNYYLHRLPVLDIPAGNLIDGIYDPNLSDRQDRYGQDLQQLSGRGRVWVVFSMDPNADRAIIEAILDHRGQLQERRVFNGSTADLYDLR